MRFFVACVLVLTIFSTTAASGETSGISPTTGLQTDRPYRPVLVQISNSKEGRPIIGLADADIIYEAIYWGPRHTRYMAVFNDNHPVQVGPLRSTRVYWNEIREMWDCPFAFWGRQGSVENRIDTNTFFTNHNVPGKMLFDGTRSGLAMSRTNGRISPHNAVVDVNMLVNQYWPIDENGLPYIPTMPNLSFSDDESHSEVYVSSVEVVYDAKDYAAKYIYNPTTEMFERWYDNKPQVDASGKPIVVANVIVLYMHHSFYANDYSLPIIKTTGSGPMVVFSNGTHSRGVWYREGVKDWFRYIDGDGKDISFSKGKTFIQIVPMDMEIHVTDTNGIVMAYDASR